MIRSQLEQKYQSNPKSFPIQNVLEFITIKTNVLFLKACFGGEGEKCTLFIIIFGKLDILGISHSKA